MKDFPRAKMWLESFRLKKTMVIQKEEIKLKNKEDEFILFKLQVLYIFYTYVGLNIRKNLFRNTLLITCFQVRIELNLLSPFLLKIHYVFYEEAWKSTEKCLCDAKVCIKRTSSSFGHRLCKYTPRTNSGIQTKSLIHMARMKYTPL